MIPAASVCSRYTISWMVCKSFIENAEMWVSVGLWASKWELVHVVSNGGIWCWYRMSLCKGQGMAEVEVGNVSAMMMYGYIGWNIMNRRGNQLMIMQNRCMAKVYWRFVSEDGYRNRNVCS
nr:hypothetical protein [Cyanidioschyzonaceae sp. 1]UNJ15461.1 hypothetical protein [Cyanidioschyzonaceae sp. 1]